MKKHSVRETLSDHDMSTRQLYSQLIHQSESSVDSESNWLITLSDVFTLLLVFMTMFIITTKNSTGPEKSLLQSHWNTAPVVESVGHETEIIKTRIMNELVGSINTLDMGDAVSVLATSREVIVTMKEQITFRPADAEILASSEPVLDNIADIISRYPDFLVEIVGHTDNIPISTALYPSNWELSVARAKNVLKYFITHHFIDSVRLSIKGYADQKPLAPNDSAENRAKNRRVEIRLKEIEA
jgi:chemotaxis protein MotB